MKSRKNQDERVIAEKRKIGSDAFQILFFGLLLSVLIQQFILNAPLSQYAVEIILFWVASFYVLIRNIMVGNDIFISCKGQKLVLINSLVCGLSVTTISAILNYTKFGDLFKTDFVNTVFVSLITFLCASVTAFAVFEIIFVLNKKKQMQIEAKFEDEDEKE